MRWSRRNEAVLPGTGGELVRTHRSSGSAWQGGDVEAEFLVELAGERSRDRFVWVDQAAGQSPRDLARLRGLEPGQSVPLPSQARTQAAARPGNQQPGMRSSAIIDQLSADAEQAQVGADGGLAGERADVAG